MLLYRRDSQTESTHLTHIDLIQGGGWLCGFVAHRDVARFLNTITNTPPKETKKKINNNHDHLYASNPVQPWPSHASFPINKKKYHLGQSWSSKSNTMCKDKKQKECAYWINQRRQKCFLSHPLLAPPGYLGCRCVCVLCYSLPASNLEPRHGEFNDILKRTRLQEPPDWPLTTVTLFGSSSWNGG